MRDGELFAHVYERHAAARASADRVAAAVAAQAVRAPLTSALAGLAARDRDVLLLVAWADLTYQEVADVRVIPIGTVRSRIWEISWIGSIASTGSLRSGRPRGRPRRPLLWMIPVGAGLAATALVATMLVTGPLPEPEGALTLDARTVLMAAADAAAPDRCRFPSPTAFVYTRSRGGGYQIEGGIDGAPVVGHRVESVREAWLSVDGRQDGAVTPSGSTDLTRIQGCPDPTDPTIREDGQGGCTHCFVDPAYLPDLPTGRSGALARPRHRRSQDEPVRDDREAFANDRPTATAAVGISVGMVTGRGS